MYTVRVGLMALLLTLAAGTANGQGPVSTEKARGTQKQPEDAKPVVQNAQNVAPVAPNAVKEMHDMDPTPAVWAIYETATWVCVFAGLVLFVVVFVGGVRLYQRHLAPADPAKVALSDPWVRANLGRLQATEGGAPGNPESPQSEG